jgi:multidrug efflux pump subunit AcrB
MEKFISLCVKRPVMVIMGMTALMLGGVFSLFRLPLDRLPEIIFPGVSVETVYAGMGAAEVRTLITIPLEDALSSVKGLERIRSVSGDGSSLISLDFRWGTDPSAASVLVREAVDAVYPGLPEGVTRPRVSSGDSAAEPHAVILVRAKNGDRSFAGNLAEYELRARLRRIDGAGKVILSGGVKEEERIRLDLPALVSRGISPDDFTRLLSRETAEIPAGNAREGDMELTVISSAKPESAEELAAVILPALSSSFRLRDAAELKLERSPLKSVFIENGKAGTALEIYRRPGADPVRLSRDIKNAVDEASSFFSRDAEITLVYDASGGILKGVKSLGVSFFLGSAAVIISLVIFMGKIRYGILAALSIPLSAAAGICVLALTGRSLNSMSLCGLALGTGIVSDTAVLVLDLLQKNFGHGSHSPLPGEIGAAAASVSGSSFASDLTTAVVFIPIVFLPGPLGALYGDLSVTLVSSIAMGWIYALCCIPSLYRGFFKPAGICRARTDRRIHNEPEKIYRRFLRMSLRRPRIMVISACAAAVLGGFLLFARPVVFVNPDEAAELVLTLNFPPGTVLEAVEEGGARAMELLRGITGIRGIFGRAGSEDEDSGRRMDASYRKEELVIRCMLEKNAKPEKVMAAVRGVFSEHPLKEAETSVSFPRDPVERILGLSSALSFAVKGRDRSEALRRAGRAEEELKRKTGAAPVQRPLGTRPELRFFPDREAAAWLGISSSRIAEILYTLSEGVTAAELEIEGRPLEVRVSGKAGNKDAEQNGYYRESDLGGIPFISSSGGAVTLDSLGKMERHESPAVLARLDRSDVIYLDLFPASQNAGNTEAAVKEVSVPGISRADESAFSRYRSSLFVTLVLVLILLYLTMGAQFESFILPLILMLAVPFSLAGTGPALLISGMNPDSGTLLGLVVLFGLSVNNGIVLYEISAGKRSCGMNPAAAVYAGALERFRPVLITSATTIFALLPLVLSPLGNSQRSMALAMMSGMIASTVFTLLALPPVFIPFLGRRA